MFSIRASAARGLRAFSAAKLAPSSSLSAACVLPTFSARSFSQAASQPQVCAVLGAQWGDEGKGKLVDILAAKYDFIARFNGGANAGHTLVVGDKKFAFHLLPCGMLYDGKVNVIGNGTVIHLPTMFKELEALEAGGIYARDRLKISDRAHLLFDFHQIVDGANEEGRGSESIGTTKRGIGPCYSSKATRNGVRVGDLKDFESFKVKLTKLIEHQRLAYDFEYDIEKEFETYAKYRELVLVSLYIYIYIYIFLYLSVAHVCYVVLLFSFKLPTHNPYFSPYNPLFNYNQPMIEDTSLYINSAIKEGKTVLTEGANAALLDVDHGTYPYVTSSAVAAGGISTGLGVPPRAINSIVGVVKAYTTRVGAGPFPTEQLNAAGEHLGTVGAEFGTTTGRARRCGWLDIPVVRYSHMLSGYDSLNITKLDVLTGLDEVKIGTFGFLCVVFSILSPSLFHPLSISHVCLVLVVSISIYSRSSQTSLTFMYEFVLFTSSGAHYTLDGKRLPEGYMPAQLDDLGRIEVEYETLPGWKEDISKCRSFNDLPANAQAYLKRVEELSGVPLSWIGVGPARDAMFHM